MKIKLATIICLLLLATGVHAISDPGQAEKKYCHAIVQDHKAAFVFPITGDEHWTWYNKETKDNALEYSWELELRGEQNSFNFGVYLFKFPGKQEETGSLEQLLKEAQWSVFDQKPTPNGGTTATILEDLRITSRLIDGGVVVGITDKETFNRIFAIHPKVAHFVMRTPSDVPFKCDATIEYQDQKDQQEGAKEHKSTP
jgi:hypothetical protein